MLQQIYFEKLPKEQLSLYSEIAIISDNQEKALKAKELLSDLDIPIYVFLINNIDQKTMPEVIAIENIAKIEQYLPTSNTSRIYLSCF